MRAFRTLGIAGLLLLLATTDVLSQNLPRRAILAQNRPLPSLRAAAAAVRHSPVPFKGMVRTIPNHIFAPDRRAVNGSSPTEGPVQTAFTGAPTTFEVGFDGASNVDNGNEYGFIVAPPDTDGDVGPAYVVQMVNLLTTIYDKTGTKLLGPMRSSYFWQDLTGTEPAVTACRDNDNGDPIVLYDEAADRWIVSQFAFDIVNNTPVAPFAQCVAVSQTGDPTGAYNRYVWDLSSIGFNDYPKLGVTSDAITYVANIFSPPLFLYTGPFLAAMDKQAMYAGDPAWMEGSQLSLLDGGYVAADVDGPGGGAYVPPLFATAMSWTAGFNIWRVNATFDGNGGTATQVASIPIPSFDADLCGADREACIPQPAPGPALEAMSDRMMHRLAIRDFGPYQSMVATHTIDVGGGRAGIRWYEMRKPNPSGSWSLYQSGTYGPNDGLNRWMPSIAINAAGDIGLGYLVASSTQFLSVGLAGQTAAASGSGTLDSDEIACVVGSGVQLQTARAGDYSATVVDPVTDTFWHTNEYVASTGTYAWATHVCEFSVSGSGEPPPTATEMTVSDVTTGAYSASRGQKGGTATVTVISDVGTPVEGALVTGNFSGDIAEAGDSGVTGADGTVTIQTGYTGKFKGDPVVTFCVSDVDDTHASRALTYVPNATFACSTGGGTATHVVVASVTTGQSGVGQGQKVGTASVLVLDDLGNPASGYTVTGDFSGDIPETGVTGTTDASGVATLQTTDSASGKVTVDFCVSGVSSSTSTLTWDPSASVGVCGGAGKGFTAPTTAQPRQVTLEQNYPNPFNPTTVIGFDLAAGAHVSLRVYDVLGREVAALVDGYREPGHHRASFDASQLPAGVYLYVLDAPGVHETRRMTLLK